MDPETLRTIFHNSATILCLDMPVGAEFGIDLKSWVVGPKFKGVKMIPHGLHFVYYSLPEKYSSPKGSTPMSFGSRIGFWIVLSKGEVLVKKWDKINEDFIFEGSPHDLSTEDKERYILGVKRYDFDSNLGAFDDPKENLHEEWTRVTSYISEKVLNKLISGRKKGKEHRIWSAAAFEKYEINPIVTKISKEEKEKEKEKEIKRKEKKEEVPIKKNNVKNNFYQLPMYTMIPRHSFPPGSSPQEITKHSMDNTYMVTKLIETYSNKVGYEAINDIEAMKSIAGEMQFAFLNFLVGNSYEAFEQWKKMINSVCGIIDGITTFNTSFLKIFLSVIEEQLKLVPKEFFVGESVDENFLITSFKQLFEEISYVSIEGNLHTKIIEQTNLFRKFFKKRFNIELSSLNNVNNDNGGIPEGTFAEDEYSPVIVNTTLKETLVNKEKSMLYDDEEEDDEIRSFGVWEGDKEKKTLWEKLDMIHIEE